MDKSSSGIVAKPFLTCQNVWRWFGGVKALDDVSLEIMTGELFGLVGPNGSGKTTLVNAITGFYPPQRGRIIFDDQEITKLRPHKVSPLGIARTFQNLGLFRGMSVLDNILMGRHTYMRPSALRTAFYWWLSLKEEVGNREMVEEIIDFLHLESVRHDHVDVLPIGLQKRVELARALAAEPRLLILDEPMAGMNVEEKEYMARFVLDIHYERGVTIIIIEHHLDVVIGICDRMAVLNYGVKIAEGPPQKVIKEPAVVTAYTSGRGK
jgi:branched-chain amino acid transport system ATP-binding protein